MTADFLLNRPDEIIDLPHPMAVLSLKQNFDESDESVAKRCVSMPTWQCFTGNEYSAYGWPCASTRLLKFRKLFGEEVVIELLALAIGVAVSLKAIGEADLGKVIVDTTVLEKAIGYPTDSKLLRTACAKPIEANEVQCIQLKKTFGREGQALARKAGRCVRVRQFKRNRRTVKHQSLNLVRWRREISCKLSVLSVAFQGALNESLNKAIVQTRSRKTQDKQPMPCRWHAPEVEYMTRRKCQNLFEFSVKVGLLAGILKGYLIGGNRASPGNPYDSHTLNEQTERATILMQSTGTQLQTAFVNLGHGGVHKHNPGLNIRHRDEFKTLIKQDKALLQCRHAIEPIVGHLKSDHRLHRWPLKGEYRDCLHTVLCAAGCKLHWMLRKIFKRDIGVFLPPLGFLNALINIQPVFLYRWNYQLFFCYLLII